VGVDPLQDVQVTFSEAMDPASADGALAMTFGHVTGYTWLDDHTVVFYHDDWPAGMPVTATISTLLADVAGNHLAADYTWSFTVQGGDTTPPDVTSITPADGAANVPLAQDVVITFTEPMDQFCAQSNVSVVPGDNLQFVWSDSTTLVVHHDPWSPDVSVTVTVGAGACDVHGNTMGHEVSATFTTSTDATPPEIVSIDPPNGAVIDPSTSQIVITFSEPVDMETFTFDELTGQLLTLVDVFGWNDDTSVLTMYLNGTLPEGATLGCVIGAFSDLSGNLNTSATPWRVTVSGTPDYYPVNESWLYGFFSQSVDNYNPVWDGNWWTFYQQFRWEDQAAGTFRLEDLDTPGDVPNSWQYMTKLMSRVEFRGFHEVDESAGDTMDVYFDPAAQYMNLPVVPGDSWSGSAVIATPDGNMDLHYSAEVLPDTVDVDIPIPAKRLLPGGGAVKTSTQIFWDDCLQVRLYHDMLAGADTMEVGIDTLSVVPGYGVVQQRSYSRDLQAGEWEWENDILFSLRGVVR